ncbi:MAG TPA: FtsX-like permease family protein, partial [Chitinophagaceae bacterium]
TIAELKGVDKNYPVVTGISRKIIRGNYDTGTDDSPMAVVGIGIEAALGIDVQRNFIPVTVYIPKRDAQSFVLPEEALNTGQIRPAGTFAIQQDFDNKYVITNIQFMRQMLNMQPGEVSGLEIALKDPGRMEAAKQEIQQILGSECIVQTRYEQNRSLYNVMQTEKWAVYAILAFILIIAAFNMIGSLYMLVIEKRKDITILKAMGARDTLLRKIFLSEGLLIAAGGALIGALIAVALCLLQQKFGLIKLGGGSFVVDAYPVSMHWPDFVLVLSTILIIGILASWYPAAKAARQPIELKAQ